MQNIIKYSGLKNLSEEEQDILKNLIENNSYKITRLIKNTYDLAVNVKTLKKESRKRFIISLKLEAPTKILTVKTKDTEKGGDWDLAKATHQAINSLCFEIKKRFRTDTESWKKGGIKKFFNRLKL